MVMRRLVADGRSGEFGPRALLRLQFVARVHVAAIRRLEAV